MRLLTVSALLMLCLPITLLAESYQLQQATGKCDNPVFVVGSDNKSELEKQTLQFDGKSLTLRLLPIFDSTKHAPVDLDESISVAIDNNKAKQTIKQTADSATIKTDVDITIHSQDDTLVLNPMHVDVAIDVAGSNTPIFNCEIEATYHKQKS